MTIKEKYIYIYEIIHELERKEEQHKPILLWDVVYWRERKYPKNISLDRESWKDFSNWVLDLMFVWTYKNCDLEINPNEAKEYVYRMLLSLTENVF